MRSIALALLFTTIGAFRAEPIVAASRSRSEVDAQWKSLSMSMIADGLQPGQCEYPWKITVDRSGSYVASPCGKEGPTRQGKIAAIDLKELESIAGDLKREAALGPFSCERAEVITEAVIELELESHVPHVILDLNFESICYRGGSKERIQRLYRVMEDLLVSHVGAS